jgi:hypothetical protein
MICQECKTAGDLNSQNQKTKAYRSHNKCKGCECQHKVGTGWFVRKGEVVPPMRVQSP